MHSQALLPTLLLVYDQGGKTSTSYYNSTTTSKSSSSFPLAFKRVLTAIGTIDANVGEKSQANIDDGVSWTLTKVMFEHFTHYYVAIGV